MEYKKVGNMRFIPLENLKEGMIIGKKIYGNNGQLLLNYGAKLQKIYIEKISELGYKGLYIEDDISKDIKIDDVIDESLKYEAISTVRKLSQKLERGNSINKSDYGNIASVVSEMLDQILVDKNILINMIDLKTFDDYTFAHSVNVGVISMSIGAHMNMNRLTLSKLGIAAFMHDLGKLYIPKEILNKPGKLTDDEMQIMKTHSKEGYLHITNKIQISDDIKQAVLDHHERPDGTGYPIGKRDNQITRMGSIISIADVYDALTSDRPYRKGKSPSESIEYIMANVNSQFSEKIVNVFLKRIAPYPVGTLVKLSNDTTGIVMLNFSDAALRPKVKILMEYGEKVNPYLVDLKNDSHSYNITVVENSDEDI